MAVYNPPRILIPIKWQKIICFVPIVNVITCAICWLYFRTKNVTKATRSFRLFVIFPTMVLLSIIMAVLPEGTVWATVGNNVCGYAFMWAVARMVVWDQDNFCKEQNHRIKEYEDSLK